MLTMVLALTLSCPETKMLNTSKFAWNDHDRVTLAHVKKRCGEIYPDAPCVKLFKKWGEKDYSVICGAPK